MEHSKLIWLGVFAIFFCFVFTSANRLYASTSEIKQATSPSPQQSWGIGDGGTRAVILVEEAASAATTSRLPSSWLATRYSRLPINIILSPHFDDAVLPLGGLISEDPSSVIVATFFVSAWWPR